MKVHGHHCRVQIHVTTGEMTRVLCSWAHPSEGGERGKSNARGGDEKGEVSDSGGEVVHVEEVPVSSDACAQPPPV